MFKESFLPMSHTYLSAGKGEIEQRVGLAQEGDAEVRNLLLQQSIRFISQVTSKVCKRFIEPYKDDEFSVALKAFDEAVMQFSIEKERPFLAFADLVIRRRVIDYIRKESRHSGLLSFEQSQKKEGEEGELAQSPLETQVSLQKYQLELESSLRIEEIKQYKEKLLEYRIDFMQLPTVSPKHTDARQNAIDIAQAIVNHTELRSRFLQTGKLPIKELMHFIKVSRKTVERHRIYIVAIVLLLVGDYQYLNSYVLG
jgi:RNA polymerase sigma factor